MLRPAERRLLAPPPSGPLPVATTVKMFEHDGLEYEELSWPCNVGPPTEATVVRPAGLAPDARLPAVLALHCHGA